MFINYKLADGNTALVEVTEEVAEFILEDDRLTANADRRERYHCPWHLEAMEYEGDSLAYHLTPEQIYIRKETQLEHSEALAQLTDTQLRRLLMRADGLTYREIAELEGTNVNAVRDSLESARKKLKNSF